MDPEQRRPMGTGAASLAMLSLMQDSDVQRILQENRLRLDASGELPTKELMQYIEQARKTGYVVKSLVRFPEISSLAVAVRNNYGEPVFALSVSSLTPRLVARVQQVLPLLKKESERLTKRLYEVGERLARFKSRVLVVIRWV